MYSLALYRMGRKFRLHHKKQKYGTTSLVVSIPRSAVSVATIPMGTLPNPGHDDADVLPISLPLSSYTAGSVQSLDLLQGRIMQARLLPPGTTHLKFCLPVTFHVEYCVPLIVGWIVSGSPVEVGMTEQLVFCKLRFQSPGSAPDVQCCLQISRDFSWKAYFCGKELQRQCTILQDTPHSLTAGDDVASVVGSVNSSKPCLGNPDDKYMALLPSRKGVFQDPTGAYTMCMPVHYSCDFNVCPSFN